MNDGEIFKKIINYGFDEINVRKRFANNIPLYETCLIEFLSDPNFESLQKSMSEKKYTEAFEAAHAIKGVSGNMGLTLLYDATCALVESLRTGQFDSVINEYIAVKTEYERLYNTIIPELTTQNNTEQAEATE